MADQHKLIFWTVGIVIAFFLLSNGTSLFSLQEFSTRYGPLIELSDTTDSNFNVNNIIGGELTMTVPQCFPESIGPSTQKVSLNGRKIASAHPSQSCESLVFSKGGNWDDLTIEEQTAYLTTTVDISKTFEIDASFLSMPLQVSGAKLTEVEDGVFEPVISYYIKVECTNDDHCLDEIRRTRFACDYEDYKCKKPSLIGQDEPTKEQQEQIVLTEEGLCKFTNGDWVEGVCVCPIGTELVEDKGCRMESLITTDEEGIKINYPMIVLVIMVGVIGYMLFIKKK